MSGGYFDYHGRPLMKRGRGVMKAVFPAQCKCGHLFLESYTFAEITDEGYIGFCWCGFCRTKRMVKPLDEEREGCDEVLRH